MITKEKIEIYFKYKGYYDGFYIKNRENNYMLSLFEKNDDWFEIDNIVSNLILINKGYASKSFINFVNTEIKRKTNNSRDLIEILINVSKELV